MAKHTNIRQMKKSAPIPRPTSSDVEAYLKFVAEEYPRMAEALDVASAALIEKASTSENCSL